MDERSLADVETTDATEEQDPKTFDMQAFLAGVRPTRRSVKLYPKADLIARMDELVDQIEQAPGDADVDDLIDAFEQCRAEFQTGVTFTIEKRSSEWQRKFRKDLITDLRLKVQVAKGGDLQGPEDQRIIVILHQLAEQIVVPAGVTYEQLAALGEANEGELTKLLNLQVMVNTRIAESAEVMGRNFSQRRSGNRTTSGS